MINHIQQLFARHEFKRYFENTSWLMLQQIFSMSMGLFVGVVVARYLGTEKFGFLAYSISLTSILTSVTHLGLSGLVVQDLVKNPNESKIILGTVFFLKLFAAVIGFIFLVGLAFYTEDFHSQNFTVLIIVAATILFQPLFVVEYWFLAQVQAKYTAISNLIAIFISSLLKIFFVLFLFSLIYFGLVYFIQGLVSSILMIYYFYRSTNSFSFGFSKQKANDLLSRGWMIMLGSIFAVIYIKIDQVMLKWIVGSDAVGIYAVAATLSEVWYFIPGIIMSSLFPKIIKIKEDDQKLYYYKLQQLFDFLFFLALLLALIVTFISKPLITGLYGEMYYDSAIVLSIHIWASIFIFMRAVLSKWIIMENVLIFSLITQGLGALFNIVLNYILIPHFSYIGAAIATLISYAIASYFALFFYKRTRKIFFMMSKAMISPIRYITIYRKFGKL